jgi:hypothetical protein
MSEHILAHKHQVHKHQTHNHAAHGRSIHCSVEVTELSTNKQHTDAEALLASQSVQKGAYNVVPQYFPAPHCVHVFAQPEPEVKMVIDPSAHFVHAAAPAAEM